jgi:hypothetical protein
MATLPVSLVKTDSASMRYEKYSKDGAVVYGNPQVSLVRTDSASMR